MPTLKYLTVQDILWINLQVTKRVNHFNYARLEEATFYQYAYGESNTLLPQAARFLTGFARMHPFQAGNEATAFVACLAFLRINGLCPRLEDGLGSAWLREVLERRGSAADALAQIAGEPSDGHEPLVPDVRGAVREVIAEFPNTLSSLAQPERAA